MTLPKNRRVKRGWMNLKVSKIIEECNLTRTLVLEDQEDGGRQFDYIAGQYLTFRFDGLSDKPVVRSYTMSSSPCQGDFSAITVKEVDNGFISKHLVKDVKEGDTLRARGPIGKFCYDGEEDQKRLAMVAAGSGVTPFVSIMRELAPNLGKEGFPDSLHLLVSFRSTKDLICWDTLSELGKIDNVEVVTSLSREEVEGFDYGRVDQEKLKKFLSPLVEGTTFMTCGPEALMSNTVEFLKTSNVDDACIKTESFD